MTSIDSSWVYLQGAMIVYVANMGGEPGDAYLVECPIEVEVLRLASEEWEMLVDEDVHDHLCRSVAASDDVEPPRLWSGVPNIWQFLQWWKNKA